MISFQNFKDNYLEKQDDKTRKEYNEALQEYADEFNRRLR